MTKYIVQGGHPLFGEVEISGAKNAAVAIIPAALLVDGVCRIENIPQISDVTLSLKILEHLGAGIRVINRHTVEIDASRIRSTRTSYELARKMRASYYLIGALLGRFGQAEVAMPGGCNFGVRPIDQHVKGFTALGAKVVTMSDSNGFVHDPKGIDLALVKQLKEVERKRIREYVTVRPEAEYHEGCSGVWQVPCDIALPCATQNELNLESAKALIKNGCFAVAEGANMPCTPDAVEALQAAGLLFAPAKAANAGGVATSALEMSQNSMRMSWSFEEVDNHLKEIMTNLYHNAANAAAQYGKAGDLVSGANIAGFLKVADAILAYGLV